MPLTRVEDHPECRGEGCSTETYCKNSAKGELCLDLSNQSLFSVPLDDASEPQYLQFVFLQNNHIKMLPSYFFQCLPKLRHLDLRENKLMEIPVSIAGHANLEVLLLQNNELSTLPCELGQVPRLRKLQFSGNPIIWPPGKILSEGLDAILSFLREAYMEQLGRGDMDVISKANDYECTKDVQNYTDVTSADNKMKHQSQNSFTLYGEKCLPASSTLFGTLEGKGTESSVQYEIKEKSVDEISPLKGKSKQLKGSAPLRKGTIYKDVKAPPMRPVASAGHAQAIMNGQPFPLGYRKRTASPTTTKIYETLLKKLWLNQLKCVLQSQDKALQKQKTLEALRQWRQEARVLKQTLSHHNWSGLELPYDFDSNYLKMMTRSGLQMIQNTSLETRGHEKPDQSCVKAMGLQEKLNQILATYEEMGPTKRSCQSNNTDPSTQCKLLADEMKRILDLQKAVQALRLSI